MPLPTTSPALFSRPPVALSFECPAALADELTARAKAAGEPLARFVAGLVLTPLEDQLSETPAPVRASKPTRRKTSSPAVTVTTTTLPDLLRGLAKKHGEGLSEEFTFQACPSVADLVATLRGCGPDFLTPAGLGEVVARFLVDGGESLPEPPDVDHPTTEEVTVRVPVICFYGIDKTNADDRRKLSRRINAAFHADVLEFEESERHLFAGRK